MGNPRKRLNNMAFDPLGPGIVKMQALASTENGRVVGDDVLNSEHGHFLRANWIIRAMHWRADPRQDYTNDIPSGAVVWVRRIPEKVGARRGAIQRLDGTYHTFELGIFQPAVTTPVLNLNNFRLARMRARRLKNPDTNEEETVGAPTPDSVMREWALGGICSNDKSDAPLNTSERYLVLDRIYRRRILNVWCRQLDAMKHLFMAIVAQKPPKHTTFFPHSISNEKFQFPNVDEAGAALPYVVQVLPLVSDSRYAPAKCLTVEIQHPDSSTTPIKGHAVHVALTTFPMAGLHRLTSDAKPYLNDLAAMDLAKACFDAPALNNAPLIEVMVSTN